jgi:hypothetical protein
MIDTYRNYSNYEWLEKFKFNFFGSDNTTLLSPDEFINMLKLDWWFSEIVNKDSLSELEKMDRDELLNYFKITYWIHK